MLPTSSRPSDEDREITGSWFTLSSISIDGTKTEINDDDNIANASGADIYFSQVISLFRIYNYNS